jgi:protein O-GlcNAc transferase
MRKIISFSLWGNNPKYTVGAIKNAELTSVIYPGWLSRFYIGSSVPNQIVYALEDYSDIEIVVKEESGNWASMFWRFEACFDSNADFVIFRDTDSRLNMREKNAVDEWLNGDKTFHIMRDHPYHKFPILGGMWGIKINDKYDMQNMISHYQLNKARDTYGTDYDFLGGTLYPLIKDDCCIHDEFFGGKKFPSERQNFEFVGEPFNEDDVACDNTHKEVLKRALKNEVF